LSINVIIRPEMNLDPKTFSLCRGFRWLGMLVGSFVFLVCFQGLGFSQGLTPSWPGGSKRSGNESLKTATKYYNTGEVPRARINKKVLGCLLPLSGKYESIGRRALKGIIAASEVLTSSNGMEVIVMDYGENEAVLKKSLRDMVLRDRVSVVIGPFLSSSVREVNGTIKDLRVPTVVFPLSEREFLGNPNLIKFGYSLQKQARVMAQFAAGDLHTNTFAVLYPSTRPGEIMKDAFTGAVKLLGGSVGYVNSHDGFIWNFSRELAWLKAVRPGAIFIPDGARSSAELIMKLKREKGFEETVFLGPNTWNSTTFARGIGKNITGIYFTDYFFPGSVRWVDFVNIYKEAFGDEPGFLEYQVFEAVTIIMEALRSSGVRKSDEIIERILRKGTGSFYDISNDHEDGITISPNPYILSLKRGEITALYPYSTQFGTTTSYFPGVR